MVSKYDITRRVRAAVDRADDPHLLIDMVREEQEQHLNRIFTLERELLAVKNTQRKEWTESGIWNVVRAKFEKNTIRFGSKFVHWVVGAIGVGIIWLSGSVLKLAWKGWHLRAG